MLVNVTTRDLVARRLRTVGLGSVVGLLALSIAPIAASARSVWRIEPTPMLPHGGGLAAVSCIAADDCTAVGFSVGSANSQTLAESWNGRRWTIVPTPTPTHGGELTAVSCLSASACTAVGVSVHKAVGWGALAESWNGTKWRVVPIPNPVMAGLIQLSGLSCSSASACTAVGQYIPNGTRFVSQLVESWNGTKWSIVPIPTPAGATSVVLSGVSCTSGKTCTVVGGYEKSDGHNETMVESGNGKGWRIVPTPNPAGAQEAQLSGVSCTLANACTAVSTYQNNAGNPDTLVESSNGSKWMIIPTPPPPDGGGLQGVSCISAKGCTAVGTSGLDDHSGPDTLAEGSSQ